MVDYGHTLSTKRKGQILTVLATECEARGTDATGIAYNSHGRLRIYKKPVPAHQLRILVPPDTTVITGHTRMVMHYDDMYTSDQNFAKFADYVLAHYNDYTIDTEDGKTIHAAVINNSDGAYGGEYVVMVPDDQLPVGDKSLYVTMSLDGYREYKNYGYDDNQPFMYYGIWQHPKKCLDKIETVNDMYYGEYMAGYGGINTGFYFRPESSVKAQLVTSWLPISTRTTQRR